MASGFFPLDRSDSDAKRLIAAVKEIKDVKEEFAYAASTSCTPEDAMADGMYLERLHLAIEFIEHCLRKE